MTNVSINEASKLTDFLYDIANKIIGSFGGETKKEDIEFACRFEDEKEIKEIWIEWISAYKKFARYNFNQGKLSNLKKPLSIYWAKLPEILCYMDGKPAKSLLPIEGGYVLYARLFISVQNPD